MMERLLYAATALIAGIHDRIMSVNDQYDFLLTDKELHFIIMGITGLLLLLVIHPLFLRLSRRGRVTVITFIYVFTVMLVMTAAVEIGQYMTGTGNMEFRDITSGLLGFLVFFVIFLALKGLYGLISRIISGRRR